MKRLAAWSCSCEDLKTMPAHLWSWIGFCAFVLAMLAFDLGVLHRTSHEVALKEALIWSAVWIALALVFNLGVYHWQGSEKGLQFLTGYLVELALSVDNLFVFLLVFGYFQVPVEYRHRVLFWGIVGALIMRAVFIAAGITVIARFHWITYFFGALLVASGIKMIFERNKEIRPEKNPMLKVFRRFMDVTSEYEDGQFFVKRQGRTLASPLLVVLVILESTDLIFAVDSVPAVLAITPDPFIVFTSNVLAIVGLRSMFFALQGVMKRFHYLHYGLAVVLALVGVKMLLAGFYKMPTWISLLLIVAVLSVSMISSLSSKRE
jgi:tellurite resistance protein TerC